LSLLPGWTSLTQTIQMILRIIRQTNPWNDLEHPLQKCTGITNRVSRIWWPIESCPKMFGLETRSWFGKVHYNWIEWMDSFLSTISYFAAIVDGSHHNLPLRAWERVQTMAHISCADGLETLRHMIRYLHRREVLTVKVTPY
jgi:hypothetical protein